MQEQERMDRRAFLRWAAASGLLLSPAGSALAGQGSGRRIAVVVGVSNYYHGYALLTSAGKDAQRLGLALTGLDYQVNTRAVAADTGDGVERSDVLRALKAAVAVCREGDTL